MIRFRITCEKSPGVLTKIVVGMRRSGLEILRQHVDDSQDQRVLDLDFEAKKEEAAKIFNSLKKLDGVFSIKVYMSKAKAAGGPSPKIANLGSIASNVAKSFPAIGDVVANIHAELDDENRSEQLFQIGLDVAAKRLESGSIKIPSGGGDFSTIINQAVVPELKNIGDVQFVEEGFETGLMMMSSVFTKSDGEAASSLGGTFGTLNDEAIRCDFLCGYIAGIANAVAGESNSSYEVEEIRCRNEGHPYCLFEFSE